MGRSTLISPAIFLIKGREPLLGLCEKSAATAKRERRSHVPKDGWVSGVTDRMIPPGGSYRYGLGSVLITTNKGIEDWPELLAGDEVLSTAILDRLLHHGQVINIKGRSYRLRDIEQAVALRQ